MVITGVVVFCLLLGMLWVIAKKKSEAYIADMYVIDRYLIIEGHNLDYVVLRDTQEIFYFEQHEPNKHAIDTEHLVSEAYTLSAQNQTQIWIAEQVVDRSLTFNKQTFVMSRSDDIYALQKTKDSVSHELYETPLVNDLGERYMITDFLIRDNLVDVSITTNESADIYIGFSDDETNRVYQYEQMNRNTFNSLKKVTYKLLITEAELATIRLYVRVLPQGTVKDKVKSQQLLLGELLEERVNPYENNIKVV